MFEERKNVDHLSWREVFFATGDLGSPVFSTEPPQAPVSGEIQPERRTEIRIRTIYKTGLVHRRAESHSCRFHNISDGGAMIEAGTRFENGELVRIELSPQHRFYATVAWQDGRRAGLRFSERVNCCSLIRKMAISHWGRKPA